MLWNTKIEKRIQGYLFKAYLNFQFQSQLQSGQ